MQLSAFGYLVLIVLLGAPVVAVASAIHLLKRKRAHWTDLGTVLLPPVLFVIVGRTRPDLQIGWAMLIWPILIAAATMYALGLKVALFDGRVLDTRASSRVLFTACFAGSLLLALTIGPWYD
jgi:hypothetical protein